jgi:hypothetical protein
MSVKSQKRARSPCQFPLTPDRCHRRNYRIHGAGTTWSTPVLPVSSRAALSQSGVVW